MFMKRSVLTVLLLGLSFGNAKAAEYELVPSAPPVFGSVELIQAQFEDTLPDLARLFSLGWEEINRANVGIDPWLPGSGTTVTLPGRRILPPGPREGLVVNLPAHR